MQILYQGGKKRKRQGFKAIAYNYAKCIRKHYLFQTDRPWPFASQRVVIDRDIEPHDEHGIVRQVTAHKQSTHSEGRLAATVFIKLFEDERRTGVLAIPITGRTHQIRVHAASVGMPLIGDFFYNGSHPDSTLNLMCYRLSIPLPSASAAPKNRKTKKRQRQQPTTTEQQQEEKQEEQVCDVRVPVELLPEWVWDDYDASAAAAPSKGGGKVHDHTQPQQPRQDRSSQLLQGYESVNHEYEEDIKHIVVPSHFTLNQVKEASSSSSSSSSQQFHANVQRSKQSVKRPKTEEP